MRVEILGCSINTTLLWGLTLDDSGLSHLTVSWTVEGRLPISRYRLRYKPADGSGSSQDLTPAPGPDATSATVQGLLAHTEYTLTLTSFGEDDQPNGVINGTYTTVCQHPLGIGITVSQSPTVADDSMTSSSYMGPNYKAHRARLNLLSSAWMPRFSGVGQWLQVDLGEMKHFTGTITQGRPRVDNWVTSYKLQYSADEFIWKTYANSNGSDEVFTGNTDSDTQVMNLLENPVEARYVRFYPLTWNDEISMRVEILGCSTNMTLISGLRLDDAASGHLTVSWTVVGNHPISRYRLRYQPADGSGSYQDLCPAPEVGATSATVQGLLAHTEYTLTLTSFDEDDQPNGVINGTYTTGGWKKLLTSTHWLQGLFYGEFLLKQLSFLHSLPGPAWNGVWCYI
ncbi:uncharacterized protein LOC144909027 [Branchiostoma floridae x Branchiostoma belcheri]